MRYKKGLTSLIIIVISILLAILFLSFVYTYTWGKTNKTKEEINKIKTSTEKVDIFADQVFLSKYFSKLKILKSTSSLDNFKDNYLLLTFYNPSIIKNIKEDPTLSTKIYPLNMLVLYEILKNDFDLFVPSDMRYPSDQRKCGIVCVHSQYLPIDGKNKLGVVSYGKIDPRFENLHSLYNPIVIEEENEVYEVPTPSQVFILEKKITKFPVYLFVGLKKAKEFTITLNEKEKINCDYSSDRCVLISQKNKTIEKIKNLKMEDFFAALIYHDKIYIFNTTTYIEFNLENKVETIYSNAVIDGGGYIYEYTLALSPLVLINCLKEDQRRLCFSYQLPKHTRSLLNFNKIDNVKSYFFSFENMYIPIGITSDNILIKPEGYLIQDNIKEEIFISSTSQVISSLKIYELSINY